MSSGKHRDPGQAYCEIHLPEKKSPQLKGSKDNMRGKSGAMQLYIKTYLHFDKNILIGWRIPLWLQPHLFQPRVLPLSSRIDTGLEMLRPCGIYSMICITSAPVWHHKNRIHRSFQEKLESQHNKEINQHREPPHLLSLSSRPGLGFFHAAREETVNVPDKLKQNLSLCLEMAS